MVIVIISYLIHRITKKIKFDNFWTSKSNIENFALYTKNSGHRHKKCEFHKYPFFFSNSFTANTMHFAYSVLTVGQIKLPLLVALVTRGALNQNVHRPFSL